MKKVFIDLNDVIRDYTRQYIIYFDKAKINSDFDPNEKLKYKNDDMYSPFVFSNKKQKEDFEREEFVFELLGAAKPTHTKLPGVFNIFLNDLMDEYENEVEVWFISPGEVHLQRQATLFFLSKTCCRVEHIWFPKTISEMWNQCDILITTNPRLLKEVPEGKIVIKIKTPYNKKSKSTYSYDSFMDFISEENKNNINKILKI